MEGHPGPTLRTLPQESGHEKGAGSGHRKDRRNANAFGLTNIGLCSVIVGSIV